MMANDFENGVWRTIYGVRVFIKDGQSITEALKERQQGVSQQLVKSSKATTYNVVNENDFDKYEEKSNEIFKNMTDDESEAYSLYTGDAYDNINNYLNGTDENRLFSFFWAKIRC